MKGRIDLYDREILRFLLSKGAAASSNEVCSYLSISWNTAKKHLQKLESLGLVKKSKLKQIEFWEVIEQ